MQGVRLLRSAVLAGYPEFARGCGLEPSRLLKLAGLGGAALENPDLRIPAKSFARLLELSAQAAGAEDFGLRFVQGHGLAVLGPLALLAREQRTLRDAVACMLHYVPFHNEALGVRVVEAGGRATCSLELHYGEHVPCIQATEFAVGGALRMVRMLLGISWRPLLVSFRHPAPQRLESHARLLGVPFRFGAKSDGFVFRARDFSRRLPAADPGFARQAERFLHLVAERSTPADMTSRVQRAIEELLPSGLCTAERIARHIGVARRTVHRHLARAGTSHEALLEGQRRQSAERYLSHRERPLGEVAELLGFSSASAFSRWFRTGYRITPSAWRRRRS